MMTDDELNAIERKYVPDFSDITNIISEVRELKAEVEKLCHALSQQTARADLEMAEAAGLRAEIEHLKAYGDKLADGYPDRMLPTDIQVIKDANWTFAQQLHEARAEIEQFAVVVENETGLLSDDELTPERLAEFLRCLNHQAEHASELIREKDAEIERLRAQVNETCKWTLGDDEYGFWETRCGGAVVFEEETPQANGYKYCHYCGKLIEFTALEGGE